MTYNIPVGGTPGTFRLAAFDEHRDIAGAWVERLVLYADNLSQEALPACLPLSRLLSLTTVALGLSVSTGGTRLGPWLGVALVHAREHSANLVNLGVNVRRVGSKL